MTRALSNVARELHEDLLSDQEAEVLSIERVGSLRNKPPRSTDSSFSHYSIKNIPLSMRSRVWGGLAIVSGLITILCEMGLTSYGIYRIHQEYIRFEPIDYIDIAPCVVSATCAVVIGFLSVFSSTAGNCLKLKSVLTSCYVYIVLLVIMLITRLGMVSIPFFVFQRSIAISITDLIVVLLCYTIMIGCGIGRILSLTSEIKENSNYDLITREY
jgi:hypothetical protein